MAAGDRDVWRRSIVRDTAPIIGSDRSSEEGDIDSCPLGQQRARELQVRIQACKREKRRLRAEHEDEVRRCADLRGALEARQRELAKVTAPLEVQLREAREELEQEDRIEAGALVRIEGELAEFLQLVDSKDRKIHDLEQQLSKTQQAYQRFLRDGPPRDTVVEAALKVIDQEMSKLLSEVQHREQIVACLTCDLRRSLEFMIATNMQVVGGASPDLGLEDLFPGAVRDHLGLSEHGAVHLQALYEKYELIMAEMRQSAPPQGTKAQDGVLSRFSDQSTAASGGDMPARTNTWQTSDLDSSSQSLQADERPSEVALPEVRSDEALPRMTMPALAGGLPHDGARHVGSAAAQTMSAPSEVATQGRASIAVEAGLMEAPPTMTASAMVGWSLPDKARSVDKALVQMMPALGSLWAQAEEVERSQASRAPTMPLAAVTLDEEEDVWSAAGDKPRFSGGNLASRTLPSGALPSANLNEESRVLREAMAQELWQLAEALKPRNAGDDTRLGVVPEIRAGRELCVAAAQGNEKAVKEWLPRTTSTHADNSVFLGWTVWHVAAAYGHCGVLECLKEDMFHKAMHHRATLDCRTCLGLPALGIACIMGRVEAARSLILGMAPVDVQDSRGNTPLIWALIGGQARVLVPMLLDAHADPEAANCSGQHPDILGLLAGSSIATLTRPDVGTAAASGPCHAATQAVARPSL